MKKVILNFEARSENFEELVQEAFNNDFLDFLISEETHSDFKDIKRIKVYSKESNLNPDYLILEGIDDINQYEDMVNSSQISIGLQIELKTKSDEDEIKKLARMNNVDFIIVSASDWKIIPFENLIADMADVNTELIASVDNIEEAELMLKTLELGVDGLVFKPENSDEIGRIKQLVSLSYSIGLTSAQITSIQQIPESERVCVDTTSLLKKGEGMLIGSTAKGFALVHAEVFETQFVASRPFRVNAGDVSAYILVPSDDPNEVYRTRYLSEISGGDKVFAVNTKGEARIVSVGRVKIETRPMLRFELEVDTKETNIPVRCICQNAETIRLVDKNGDAVSVVDIKVGDEILVHVGPGATHFGKAINESIIEK